LNSAPLWPLLFYAAAVFAVMAGMITGSWLLGQRHKERATDEPFESGVVGAGSARLRFSVQFYIVAVSFVVFDLEAVFLFAWAAAYKEAGWTGYLGMLVFVAVLVAGLIYEWREGALLWSSSARRQKAMARRPS